jgi:hypothetical protein
MLHGALFWKIPKQQFEDSKIQNTKYLDVDNVKL